MNVNVKFFGNIGGPLANKMYPKMYQYELWNNKGEVQFTSLDSVAHDQRYIVIGNFNGIEVSELLTLINKDGINIIKTLQGCVVIIDRIGATITMYRDPTGRVPLFWKIENNQLIWSNSLKNLKQKNSQINIEYIYKYLIGGGYVDSWEDTPFVNINRVNRGEILVFNNLFDFTRTKTHFQPAQGLNELSEEELYRQYRIKLHNAIYNRKKGKTLFETSSGLDSTGLIFANSISSKNKDEAFTFIFNKYNVKKEELEAQKIASQYGLNWNTQDADRLKPFSHLLNMEKNHIPEEPTPDFCFYPWRLAVFQKAKELGIRTIISGYGGDELLTGNYSYIGDLLKEQNIEKAWKSSLSLAHSRQIRGLNAWYYFKTYGLFPLLDLNSKAPSPKDWDPSVHPRFLINDYFLEKKKAKTIQKQMLSKISEIKYKSIYQTRLARELSTVFLPYGIVDSIGESYLIDMDFPYTDKDLIEFILGIPFQKTIDENNYKLFQRNAFKSYYPKDFKRGQENFYILTFRSLNEYWNEILSVVQESILCKQGIISKKLVTNYLEGWKCGNEIGSTRNLYALLSLCLWLKNIQIKEEINF